ncbi:MAG: TMEM165/GDT1 family protein [Gammaproteobacteria bacterium]|nr:TMEM165/GDT1 family protein [Gammaproteobacteria bacterium]
MDWRTFITIFATVFIAEIGDKTQLATMLYASDKTVSKWVVFGASATALILAAAIGVIAGQWVSAYVPERYLRYLAGVGFIMVGCWTLWRA